MMPVCFEYLPISNLIHAYTQPFTHNLSAIAAKIFPLSQNSEVNLSEINAVDLTVRIYEQGRSAAFDRRMRELLHEIDPRLLYDLIYDMAQREARDQMLGLCAKLMPYLSVEQMKQAIETSGQIVRHLDNLLNIEIENPRFSERTADQNLTPDLISNFFPNLLNIMIVAFSYFNAGNQPDMIWDCYLILGIYYALLTLPFTAIVSLSAIAGFLGSVAIVASVCALGAGVLYGYMNWWRSFPVWSAHNTVSLTHLAVKGQLSACVERTSEIAEVIKYQGGEQTAKKHVLVIGDPGMGKTTLLKGAAQKLYEENPNLCVYDASGALSSSSSKYNNGPIERLRDVIRHLGRLSYQSVFVVDELLNVVTEQNGETVAVDHTKAGKLRDFLDKQPVTCWASATVKEYQALLNYDRASGTDQGSSLLQRFHVIDLRNSEANVSAMVNDYLKSEKGYIPCDPDIIRAAIDISTEHRPDNQQPRNACDLLEAGIAEVRKFFEHPVIKSENESRLESLLVERKRELQSMDRSTPGGEEMVALEEEIEQIQADLERERERSHEKCHRVWHLKTLYQGKLSQEKRILEVAALLMENQENIELQKEFYLLRYFDFAARHSIIRDAEEELLEHYPIRLTEAVLNAEMEKKMIQEEDT